MHTETSGTQLTMPSQLERLEQSANDCAVADVADRQCRASVAEVSEVDLAHQFGVARPELARMRRELLKEGEHWYYTKPPRKVMYFQVGVDRIAAQLAIRSEDSPKVEEPAAAPVENNWIPNEEIPKIRPNGYILAHGRPSWWSSVEGVVKESRFLNRRAVLVTVGGKDVICRVKDAKHYPAGMVIPLRPYENIYVAARHPRFPGKW